MFGKLPDELLPDHSGCAENAYVDFFRLHNVLHRVQKKTRRPFWAGGWCDPAVSSVSYVTISHTPGLRIRFVRFRQTVWGVVRIVTIFGSIAAGTSNRQILYGRGADL
jgi:hypothetical protein